jgi:L-fucose isomerase-like protein
MILRQIADALSYADARQRNPQHRGAAFCGMNEAEKNLDEGGFAGTVRAEQAEDLALLDLERDILERNDRELSIDEVRINFRE